jgi:hypothetical protein
MTATGAQTADSPHLHSVSPLLQNRRPSDLITARPIESIAYILNN